MEEVEETTLNAAVCFSGSFISSNFTGRRGCYQCVMTLDRTVRSIEDEDQEVSFWIDEEQRQEEKRTVLYKAISHITDGIVSPIASSHCSNWESTSSSQKSYQKSTPGVFCGSLNNCSRSSIFEALLRSSGHEIREENPRC